MQIARHIPDSLAREIAPAFPFLALPSPCTSPKVPFRAQFTLPSSRYTTVDMADLEQPLRDAYDQVQQHTPAVISKEKKRTELGNVAKAALHLLDAVNNETESRGNPM